MKAKTGKKNGAARKNGAGAAAIATDPELPADGKLESVLKEVVGAGAHERLEDWLSLECPYCGEGFEVHVTSEHDGQTMFEDCAVCCRPVQILIEVEDGEIRADAQRS
ncbi:MAG: CPXCG motif-containing cysteine-rich protein [Elusimicrobiota bacterium]